MASKRHASSLAFGLPLSEWALNRLVESIAETSIAKPALDSAQDLSRRRTLNPHAARAFQSRRFQDQCQLAFREVPYYQRLGRQLDPVEIAAGQVPITPKAALRDAPDTFVRQGGRPFIRITTTGTTGTPTAVHFSKREWHAIGAVSAIGLLRRRLLRSDDLVQICITPRAVLPNHGVTWPCAATGAVVHVVGMADPESALDLLAQQHRLPSATKSICTSNLPLGSWRSSIQRPPNPSPRDNPAQSWPRRFCPSARPQFCCDTTQATLSGR
jgi:hypothetical protein